MYQTEIQKILVLDDDMIQHFLLKKKLGFLVPNALIFFKSSPAEALDFLEATKVDLIILDLNLPDMTGWEFAEILKEKIVDSKIILVSGSVSTEEFEKAEIDRFIHAIYEKPISETDLREILGV